MFVLSVPSAGSPYLPPSVTATLRSITEDMLARVRAGDQTGPRSRIKDLETVWDNAEPALRPLDGNAWHVLDGQIDRALTAVRAGTPDAATETADLAALSNALG